MSVDRLALSTAILVSSDLVPHTALVHRLVLVGLQAEEKRTRALKPLLAANLERSKRAEEETAAIHRAADKWLTPRMIDGKSRRAWPRQLWQWLWSEERCLLYGLERRPTRRRISEALSTWTPPHGAALSGASNALSDEQKGGTSGSE